eukprot:2537563-Amphidinium_carterae.1
MGTLFNECLGITCELLLDIQFQHSLCNLQQVAQVGMGKTLDPITMTVNQAPTSAEKSLIPSMNTGSKRNDTNFNWQLVISMRIKWLPSLVRELV